MRTIRERSGRRTLAGCLLLLAGVAVTFGAIAATTSVAFLAGTAVAGAGFGLGFSGAFRMTIALATPAESAGLVTAIFTVGYLAFSVPALIAGVAATKFGLHSTALVYSASLAVLVAVATGICCSAQAASPPGQPPPRVRPCHRDRALVRRARRPWHPANGNPGVAGSYTCNPGSPTRSTWPVRPWPCSLSR